MKDTVFISHSFPEDNYSAIWLASKLKVLGYKVWVDHNDLATGDSFNSAIGPIIKNKAKVFIALTTKAYSHKATNPNSGVSRELNASDTIDVSALGHNFLLPVRFDNVEYNDFPYHYQGKNAIDFKDNWQDGLMKLVKELEKINFPRISNLDSALDLWYDGLQLQGKPLEKEEQYYSNWFPFNPPTKVFICTPEIFIKEELYNRPYPYILEANRVISFASNETVGSWTVLKSFKCFDIQNFYQNDDLHVDDAFTLKEPKKKLIKLLNVSFQKHLFSKGLLKWKRGKTNKSVVFYFRHDRENKMISLKRYNKPRGRRMLVGNVKAKINDTSEYVNWSFSINGDASLDPIPHYKVFF